MMEKNEVILQVRDLKVFFPVSKMIFQKQKYVKAVNGVSFDLIRGETLGVAGESGCGKSTLLRACVRLNEPTDGKILLDGLDITHLSDRALRPLRKKSQVIFQDPYSSLDNRWTVGRLIEEPMKINKIHKTRAERTARAKELMQAVGLSPEYLGRFPHEFSGGQRQRIAIACALATSPDILMCDEAVSALDVSVRAQVLNLFADLQKKFGLTYMFVSHDMSVIEHICDRVAIMYLGRIMEIGAKRKVFDSPAHPYTQALLSAVPSANEDVPPEKRIVLEGDIPSPVDQPSGCVFHTRCRYATERCKREVPELKENDGRLVACHKYEENKQKGEM